VFVVLPGEEEVAMSHRLPALLTFSATFVIVSLPVLAATYTDDFSNGLDPEHWILVSNQVLYTCAANGEDVLLSKPQGGGGWGQCDFVKLCFSPVPLGNWDVSVDFSDAVMDWNSEHWGNELALEVGFGPHYFQIGRGDGADGDWVGTWVDPPGEGSGFPEAATSGRLRLARIDHTLTAYFNDTVVHSGDYVDEQVTHLCLSLKNNYASDALSVRFDNFAVVAEGFSPARQVARIEASDGEADDEFGAAIALHGNTLAVAAQQADRDERQSNRTVSGAVYIYDRDPQNPSSWEEVARISQPEGETVFRFGQSVALHETTLVVASQYACTGSSPSGFFCEAGAVYIFDRDRSDPGTWGLVKGLTTGGPAPRFGASVSIDGDLLVVGSPGYGTSIGHGGPGRAFVFQRSHGGPDNWGQVAELSGSDTEDGDRFGTTVSISGDKAVVGAPRTDNACPGESDCWSGSAYVFERDSGGPNNWGQVRKLSPDDLVQNDQFGKSAVIDGDTILIGINNHSPMHGAVYVFQRDDDSLDNWGQVIKLSTDVVGSAFGSSLELRRNVVLVGDTGSAVLLARSRGGIRVWGEVARLSRRTGWSEGGFPSSLAIGDELFVVGATSAFKAEDSYRGGENVGAVYVFTVGHCTLDRTQCPPRRPSGRAVPRKTETGSFSVPGL